MQNFQGIVFLMNRTYTEIFKSAFSFKLPIDAISLTTQPAITYSKLTIETQKQGVKYVQS